MKIFFAALKNLALTDFDCEFLELLPGVKITNKTDVKDRILTELVRDAIGIIESNTIHNSDAFVYYEYEGTEKFLKGHTNLESLNFILLWIDDFLKNSWLHKDNCITCDIGYLIDFSKKEVTEASSLRLQYMLTMADGDICDVTLSKKDLTEISDIHDKLETYLFKKDSGSTKFMLEKNFSRIGRALLFVKQAREARNLAYKITNYCAALETLFTTESAELSHKLAERTAYFISSAPERLTIYKVLKKAYSIRSKLTHGSSLEQKSILEIPDISIATDKIIRRVFEKVIFDDKILELFDSRNSKIDEYFENLVFG